MKKFKYDKEMIKLHANGQWHYIFEQLCPELSLALQRPGKHTWCPNPGHRGKNGDAFRLFHDYNQTGGGVCNTCGKYGDGIAIIMWLTGWSFQETLEVIARTIGLEPSSSAQPERVIIPPPVIDTTEEDQKLAKQFCQSLNRTWNQSISLASPEAEPVRFYLAGRGLNTNALPPTLRYHPSLAYYDQQKEVITGHWPAMVALVQNIEGKPITLHRTYLTSTGQKAPVAQPKKLMSYPKIDRDLRGAAIRLDPKSTHMGVTEGLETGLSVRQATQTAIWVAITSGLMEVIDLPTECQAVVAWADKDPATKEGKKPGLFSAKKFVKKQWELGRRAGLVLPKMELGDKKSVDWNDVLIAQGASAFPAVI